MPAMTIAEEALFKLGERQLAELRGIAARLEHIMQDISQVRQEIQDERAVRDALPPYTR